jgi:hypothetical protein
MVYRYPSRGSFSHLAYDGKLYVKDADFVVRLLFLALGWAEHGSARVFPKPMALRRQIHAYKCSHADSNIGANTRRRRLIRQNVAST